MYGPGPIPNRMHATPARGAVKLQVEWSARKIASSNLAVAGRKSGVHVVVYDSHTCCRQANSLGALRARARCETILADSRSFARASTPSNRAALVWSVMLFGALRGVANVSTTLETVHMVSFSSAFDHEIERLSSGIAATSNLRRLVPTAVLINFSIWARDMGAVEVEANGGREADGGTAT